MDLHLDLDLKWASSSPICFFRVNFDPWCKNSFDLLYHDSAE